MEFTDDAELLNRFISVEEMKIEESEEEKFLVDEHAMPYVSANARCRPYSKNNQAQDHKKDIMKPFICEFCSGGFTSPNNLRRHVKMKHLPPGERLLVCCRCNFKTYEADALTIHRACHETLTSPGDRHRASKPFQCYHCGNRFVSHYGVRKHIISKHPVDRVFKCDHCPFISGLRYRLNEHMSSHRSKQKVINSRHGGPVLILNCAICGAKTPRSYLSKHMRMCHSNRPAPFACNVCNFKTWFSKDLIYHSYIHTGERPFVCFHCGHTSKRKEHIKLHVIVCFRKEKFRCTFCGFKPRNPSQRRRHISKCHQGVK